MSSRFIVRQEPDSLAKRRLLATTIGSFVAFGAAVAVSAWILAGARAGRDTGPAAPSAAPPAIGMAEQGLILAAPRGLDEQRAHRASLEHWGWIDRDAGVARIPIERAMDLVAADGGSP
jgi:threonine/homoserine efflux transporter RhtA